MPGPSAETVKNWAIRGVITLAVIVVVAAALIALLLHDRPSLDSIAWPSPVATDAGANTVTATWLGVSTLLFDDGNTQILIDGFFSRPSIADIVFGMPVETDAAQINYVLDEYQVRRLAAIIPVHSHFDHAMDIGAIANRSSASILGSATTAQIARGAGVPEDQIVVVSNGAQYSFGEFSVTMIESVHAPIGWGGSTPLAGTVDEPLNMPSPITAWREGQSYSIVVAHTQGTTLVQGSAGYLEHALDEVQADVVMLGAYGLEGLGYDYTEKYWQTLVTATGATRVYPVHFDDYTRPFGVIELFPRILDNFPETALLLETLKEIWDTDTRLYLPQFGQKIVLYPHEVPEI